MTLFENNQNHPWYSGEFSQASGVSIFTILYGPFATLVNAIISKWLSHFSDLENLKDFGDMFEQFLSEDIGCGPFFDHIKRSVSQFYRFNQFLNRLIFLGHWNFKN